MASLILKEIREYFTNEQEKLDFIYDYIDKLIVLFPDYDNFQTHEFIIMLEPNLIKRKKIYSVASEIDNIMIARGYVEIPSNANAMLKMTDIGRIVKSKKGHFNYLKSIKPKSDYIKIGSFVVALCSLIITAIFLTLNYRLSQKRDKLEIENKKLHIIIDSMTAEK